MPEPAPAAPGPSEAGAWDRYVAEYHDATPGITEDILAGASDVDGRSPYQWLVEAVPADASIIVDLACGSSPVARLLGAGRVVGVDQSAGELARARASGPPGPLVRARAAALPIAGGRADAVVASMALMLLCPLEAVLAEVRRLLRPGGTFAATVPLRSGAPGPAPAPAFAEILDALGQAATNYPEGHDDGTSADRFSSADLTLLGDDVRLFSRVVLGPDDAELVVRSMYAPGAGRARVDAAVAGFQRRVRAAPVRVDYRVRRLVARR